MLTAALSAHDGFEALDMYARGLSARPDRSTVKAWLVEVKGLDTDRLPGREWVMRLLAAASGTQAAAGLTLNRLYGDMPRPVVILAGGTSSGSAAAVATCAPVITTAFSHFTGTVVSGGTRHGVAALAGDVGEASRSVWTVGYVPGAVPPGTIVDRDPCRYRQLRVTQGDDFSPLESVQAWIDIVASGIEPAGVRLLGLGGGRISRVEYHVALALGARVGVIPATGRAAAELVADDHWGKLSNLESLLGEVEALRAFIR